MADEPTPDYAALLDPVVWPEAEGIALSAQWEGKPVIAGTRWPVHIIGDYGAEPLERAVMKSDWPHLSDAQIDAAVTYYTTHRALFVRDRYQRYVTREELLEIARALSRLLRPAQRAPQEGA